MNNNKKIIRKSEIRNNDNRSRSYNKQEHEGSSESRNRRNDSGGRVNSYNRDDRNRDNTNRRGKPYNGNSNSGNFRSRDDKSDRGRKPYSRENSNGGKPYNRENSSGGKPYSRDNRNAGRQNRNHRNDDSRKGRYRNDSCRNDSVNQDCGSHDRDNIHTNYNIDVANDDTITSIHADNRKKKSIINMSFAEVKALCVELGYPEFHASQILDFIYKRNVLSFDDISPLPKSLREKLHEGYYIHNCSVKAIQTDESNTKKMLISLYDNKEVEAVILQKDERITFCLSSQVGCAYGCKFCATGTMGFKRNLSSEEILAQFLLLRHEAKSVNSIVFMGMGEPLANAKNVFAAIREINNYKGFNLGIRHITISTVGEVGGIKSLIERDLDVRLAVSLHSLKDDVRSSIMPINKKYPLKRLLPMLKRYSSSGKRIVTLEWVLIDAVNDTVNDAYRLVNLKREFPFKVNLIALNPVEGSAFKPSSKDNMKRFAKILTDNGVTVVQRFKQGQKIAAGCGQLAIKTSRMPEH